MAPCAIDSIGSDPEAMGRSLRPALKGQSKRGAMVDPQAGPRHPREQTVRHVHVNKGGQAIVADHFHRHAGAMQNGESANQSRPTRAAGQSAALHCPDAGEEGVPITSSERAPAVPDARRD